MAKRRRRKLKKKAVNRLICLLVLIITAFVLVISFVSTMNNNNGYSKLEKEVNELGKSINNNTLDIEDLKVKYKTKISKNKELEEKVEKYLFDVADIMNSVNIIRFSDKYTKSMGIDNLKKENNLEEIDKYYDDINEELIGYKTKLIDIKSSDYIKSDDTDITDYNKIVKGIDKEEYIQDIDNLLEEISLRKKIITYLKDNSGNYELNEKITFLTKSSYNGFKELVNDENIVEYELTKDTKGPVINASDVSISVGTTYDLSKNINCLDDLDGKVECSIDGTYNTNKVGSYKVTIKSTDTSNNTSTKEITITVKDKQVQVTNKKKYYTEVIRNQNTVIVYGLDDNNEYTKIVKVFPCSVGANGGTPTGTFTTSAGARWGTLFSNVPGHDYLYGQYSTRIVNHILFHSVPYLEKNNSSLEWEEYNKLGTAASMGCIRMTVADVKWIYDNCPLGMTVKIYDGDLPEGVEKPTAAKIDPNSPNKGWDPTDPDPNNPWNK